MATPPVGKVIDRLEVDGWVERRNDPDDRRANRIFLTPKSTPLLSTLEQIAEELGEVTTRRLSKQDREAFARFLRIAHFNWTNESAASRD